MSQPLVVGTVLYDPKVSVIWAIIRDYFEQEGCPIEVVFYSTYALQVEGLLHGQIDIAWNSPLAWLDAERRSGGCCRAIAMRDTDRDRASYLVARRDGPIKRLEDLAGRSLAVGASDSPQATLIPLGQLTRRGLLPGRDVRVRRFDVLVGKHGDHIGGELEALEALKRGDVDASVMMDLNWDTWTRDGTLDPEAFAIAWTSPRYDHCVFTVRADFPRDAERRWTEVLFSMRYDNPAHREMMDLEGLKAWLPGRTTGYGPLADAVEALGFFASDA